MRKNTLQCHTFINKRIGNLKTEYGRVRYRHNCEQQRGQISVLNYGSPYTHVIRTRCQEWKQVVNNSNSILIYPCVLIIAYIRIYFSLQGADYRLRATNIGSHCLQVSLYPYSILPTKPLSSSVTPLVVRGPKAVKGKR